MYSHALVIQRDTVGARLQLARELFDSGAAPVILEGLALKRDDDRVSCSVITSLPATARTPHAFEAEIASALEMLESSTFLDALDGLALEWCVIEDYGMGTVQLWPPVERGGAAGH